jgi:HD-GYP domain-containing protein (c-di-GMP phosphodiesterase class II)
VGIARALDLDENAIDTIGLGSELHDIGKIGVPESVLLKPDRLTPEEYRQIMEHTVIGARILAPVLRDAPAALGIVRSHHEKMDGSGLPDGLKGDAIPFEARVVSVADAFDAMTSARPYRPSLQVSRAVAELKNCAGSQFDARVVEAFLDAFPPEVALPIRAPIPRPLRLPAQVAAGRRV